MSAADPEAPAGRVEVMRRRGWVITLGIGLVVQLIALYSPSGGGAPPFNGADKLVHATIFAVPVMAALVVRVRSGLVIGLAAVHAPASEIIQGTLLPQRDGDVWDAVADLTGVLAGWVIARWMLSRR